MGVDCVHDGVLSGDIVVGPLGVDATDVLMLYNARERADVNGFGPWTGKAEIKGRRRKFGSGATVRKTQRSIASSVRRVVARPQSYRQTSYLARFEAQGLGFRFATCSWVMPRQVALAPNLHDYISVRRHQNAVFRVNEASPRHEIIGIGRSMEVNARVLRSASNGIRYRTHQNPSLWPQNYRVSGGRIGKRQHYGGYFAVAIEIIVGIGIAFGFFFGGDSKLS